VHASGNAGISSAIFHEYLLGFIALAAHIHNILGEREDHRAPRERFELERDPRPALGACRLILIMTRLSRTRRRHRALREIVGSESNDDRAVPRSHGATVSRYLGYRFLAREFEDGFNYIRRLEPHKFSFEISCQVDIVEQSPEITSTDLLKRLLRSFNMNRIPDGTAIGRLFPSFAEQPLRHMRIRFLQLFDQCRSALDMPADRQLSAWDELARAEQCA
jgi:hypothetical protein